MVFDNSSVTLALLSFFSTTVDDFCVILIFFAREYVKTHSMTNKETVLSFVKISVGQFIGFSIIVGVSLILGIGLHSVFNNDYIDLIGLLPILIGLYKVYEILEEAGYFTQIYTQICKLICCMRYTPIESDTDEVENEKDIELAIVENPIPGNNKNNKNNGNNSNNSNNPNNRIVMERSQDEEVKEGGLEMTAIMTAIMTARSDREMDSTEDDEDENSISMKVILNEESLDTLDSVDKSNTCVLIAKRLFYFMDPLIFEVAIYALMFGTDNIAIYVALFSNVSLLETAAIITFFYFMLALYLVMAIFIIVQCPRIGKFIGDNANNLVPAVLITLGLFILHDSIVWHMLF